MHGNDANSLECSEWSILFTPYLYPAKFLSSLLRHGILLDHGEIYIYM